LAQITDEAMRLRLAGVPAIGLGAEIGKIVSGGKTVAVALEQDHAHSRILLRAL